MVPIVLRCQYWHRHCVTAANSCEVLSRFSTVSGGMPSMISVEIITDQVLDAGTDTEDDLPQVR